MEVDRRGGGRWLEREEGGGSRYGAGGVGE